VEVWAKKKRNGEKGREETLGAVFAQSHSHLYDGKGRKEEGEKARLDISDDCILHGRTS